MYAFTELELNRNFGHVILLTTNNSWMDDRIVLC